MLETSSAPIVEETTKEPPAILRDVPEELWGERVLLRPFRVEDAESVHEAVAESVEYLQPWLPWATPAYDLVEAQSFVRRALAKWILREDLAIGIWRREDGRFLGGTGLHRIHWDIPAFEIGYWLRKSEEGRGYMSEAITLLTRACFETLKANRLEIRCDSRNLRSANVPRRLGFVHEATLRNDSRATTGELRDTFVFALTPEDYKRVFV